MRNGQEIDEVVRPTGGDTETPAMRPHMMLGMMLRRHGETQHPQSSCNHRRLWIVRPAMQQIGHGQRHTIREKRQISENPEGRPGRNGAKQPEGRHQPKQGRATVAIEFNEAVLRQCQGIAMMFPERNDQLLSDDGGRLSEKCIAKPVQESGRQIGADDPKH